MAERLLCNPSPPPFLELEQQDAAIEELDIACEDDFNKELTDNLGVRENDDYYCKTCKFTMNSEISWYTHLNGKGHKKKLAAIYITPYIKMQAQPNTNMQHNKIAGVSEEADIYPCDKIASQLPPSALPQLLEQTRSLSEAKYFELILELTADLSTKYELHSSYEERLKKCNKAFKDYYSAYCMQRWERDPAVRKRGRQLMAEKNYLAILQEVYHIDVRPIGHITKPVLLQLIKEGKFVPLKKS